MFDRFTDRARKVMEIAMHEAQRLNSGFIGTECILVGLILEGGGIAASTLKNLGVDLEAIRSESAKLVREGETAERTDPPPFTPFAKKVLELSLEEASQLGHNQARHNQARNWSVLRVQEHAQRRPRGHAA